MQRLAERGAQPALLVHGNPTVAGETALWWLGASKSAYIIYEAYYDGAKMYSLGSLIASRRMRLGMRNLIVQFEGAGVPRARLGFMLGFHSAQTPGIGGRQGLEPTEAWLRVVKWEAFAADQSRGSTESARCGLGVGAPSAPTASTRTKRSPLHVALGPESVALRRTDDGGLDVPVVAHGGPTRPANAEQTCTFANGGRVYTSAVDRLATFTEDRHDALTVQFARAVLAGAAYVDAKSVLAIENRAIAKVFKGSRAAYEQALAKRGASVEVARGLIADELRRRGIAKNGLNGAPTMFDRLSAIETEGVDSAMLSRRRHAGVSEPISRGNDVDVGTVPLLGSCHSCSGHRTRTAVPIAQRDAERADSGSR